MMKVPLAEQKEADNSEDRLVKTFFTRNYD